MASSTRTGRRATALLLVLLAVGGSITALDTTARADNGHAVMSLIVVGGSVHVFGEPLRIAGSIVDESGSCSFGDCDTPVGTVTVTLNGVPYSAATSPSLIEPVAEWDLPLPQFGVGTYQGTADFTGNFTVLFGDAVSLSVVQRPCNTTLTQSIASTASNGAVSLTAKVSSSAAAATGTVTFYQDDGTPALDLVLATANLDQTTNTATSPNVGTLLPAGTTKIYAVYSGDSNHEADCRSNNVIHLVSADPPPTAGDDSVHTPRNMPVTFNVLVNDADPGGGALIGPEVDGAGPEHGQLTGSGTALVFQPDDGFVGDDVFTYYVTDSNGTQSPLATVAIEVTCDSVAVADTYTVGFQTPLVVADPNANLLTNDDPCERAIQMGQPPAHGTVSAFDGFNGLFTYTPAAGYSGPDTFVYVYVRGIEVVAIGRVSVVVEPDPNAVSTSSSSTSTTSTTSATSTSSPTSPTSTSDLSNPATPAITDPPVTPQPTSTSNAPTASASSSIVASDPFTGAGSGGGPTMPGGSELPITGSAPGGLLLLGAGILALGLVMIVLRRDGSRAG